MSINPTELQLPDDALIAIGAKAVVLDRLRIEHDQLTARGTWGPAVRELRRKVGEAEAALADAIMLATDSAAKAGVR